MRRAILTCLASCFLGSTVTAQDIISTVAGGGPNNLPAISANLGNPRAVASDAAGNAYVVSTLRNQVLRIDAVSGQLTLIAGTGIQSFSGEGGLAVKAGLNFPVGVALDTSGHLFIADEFNSRIRRVDLTTGIITTIAGSGATTFSGDNGPATSAGVPFPASVAFDGTNVLYISDSSQRIRRVDLSTGIISTIAGDGVSGFSGDGGPATSAHLANPTGVAVDGSGRLFIADMNNNRVRQVDLSTGVISTVAGIGISGFAGDGGLATLARLNSPAGVARTGSRLLIVDQSNHRIRSVEMATGIISTVAGSASGGFGGDGGPATSALLGTPSGVSTDSSGNLFIAEQGNNRVRRVDSSTAIISTASGNGTTGFSGEGVPALDASFTNITDLSTAANGQLYVADLNNNRVRKIDPFTGFVTTVAGALVGGFFGGDGGQAINAALNSPTGITIGANQLYIADQSNQRIRKVDLTTGIISTVAGTSVAGFNGDGLAATSRLNNPSGVAADGAGHLFIADRSNHRVRLVDLSAGTITTVAGDGIAGFAGDNGPPSAARLNTPNALALDLQGRLLIADQNNHRVRRIDFATNTITTIAGTGTAGFNADSIVATTATLNSPADVAVDLAGNVLIADQSNHRIRRIDSATGIIITIAGTFGMGFTGDAGLAINAHLAFPMGIAVDSTGALFVADTGNMRVRRFVSQNAAPTANAGPDQTVEATSASGASVVFNGSGSTDPEGQTLTYQWFNSSNTFLGSGVQLTRTAPFGISAFTLKVDDGNNGTSSDSVVITVQDTTGPSVTLTAPASTTYALNQSANASYSCSDVVSGVQSCSGNVASGQPIDTASAGSKTFTVIAKDTKDNISSRSVTYTVSQAVPLITWPTPANIVYGTPLGASQLNATASVPGTFTYVPASGTVLNVGNGQALGVTFTPTDSVSYTSATKTITINVLKTTPSVIAGGGPFVYDGNPHSATVDVIGVGGAHLSPVSVTYNGGAAIPVNAGSYAVSALFAGDGNYQSATGSGTLVISKAPASLIVSNLAQQYDGAPKPVTVATSPAGLVVVSVTYDGGSAPPTQARNYSVVATLTNANYTAPSSPATLVINPAGSAVSVVCPTSVTYTGIAQTPCTATVAGAGGLNQSLAVSYSNNMAPGTATAMAVFAGETNHGAASGSKDFTIEKSNAVVVVSGYSGAYDGASHVATGSAHGVFGEDLSAQLNLGASFTSVPGGTVHWTFTGDANYRDQDGDATTTISTAPSLVTVVCPPTSVYNGVAQTPCTAAVTGAGNLNQPLTVNYTNNVNAGTATADAAYGGDTNHDNSSGSKTFVIAKAAVTATAGSGSATFDGASHSPSTCLVTGTFTGGLTCTNSPASIGPTVGSTSIAPVPAGTGLVNFDFTLTNGSFTISPASSAVVVTCPGSVIYDGMAQTPCTAVATGAGGLSQTLLVNYSGNINAGTATADASFAADTNHTGSSGSETFTILKVAVNAKAGSGSANYDGAAKSPTACELTGPFTGGLTCTNQPASVGPGAGTTTISPLVGGALSGNFDVTPVNGLFTIEQALTTVVVTCPTSVPYNGSAQTPCSAAAIGAGSLNQSLTVNYSSNINAGPASANASFAGGGNYTGNTGSQTFEIAKAIVTATAGSGSSVYDGASHSPSACLISGGFAVGLSCANSPTSVGPGAGTTVIEPVVSGATVANFDIAQVAGSYSITRVPSVTSVTCPPSVTFNGAAQTPCTASVTGAFGLNQSLTVTYSSNVDAGTASANASYPGDTNYAASSDARTFAIARASVVATAGSGSATFDGLAKPPSACVVSGAFTAGLTCVNNPASVGPGVGTVTIAPVVSGAQVSNFDVAPVTGSYTIAPAVSTTTITCASSVTYTGSPQTPCLASFSTAGGPLIPLAVSYNNNVNAGTASADASYSGDANHAGSSDSKTFTITRASQTIAFNGLATKTVNDPPFTVSASGGASGNPVVFTTTTPTVCTSGGSNGATISLVAPGTCTVGGSQAGNANYNAATDVTQNFTVQTATTFTGLMSPWAPPGPGTYNGMTFSSGTVYKINSTLPVKWGYSLGGVLVDSSHPAGQYPVVNIYGPLAACGDLDGTGSDAVVSYSGPGATTTTYDAASKMWQRNVKLDGSFQGDKCYLIQVFDPVTNTNSPAFPFKTKK